MTPAVPMIGAVVLVLAIALLVWLRSFLDDLEAKVSRLRELSPQPAPQRDAAPGPIAEPLADRSTAGARGDPTP